MTKARQQRRANAQKNYDCSTKEQEFLLNDKNYTMQSQKLTKMLLKKTNNLPFIRGCVMNYTKAYLDVVKELEEMKEDPNAIMVFTAEFFINELDEKAKLK